MVQQITSNAAASGRLLPKLQKGLGGSELKHGTTNKWKKLLKNMIKKFGLYRGGEKETPLC